MRTLIALAALLGAVLVFLGRPPATPRVEAGTALRMDIPALARTAELILEGHVLATHPREREDGRIETEVLLQVERTFAGADEVYRTLFLPGGVLPDGRGLILPGVPGLRAGEDVLLFLTAAARSGVRMPVGLAQGKLGVVRQEGGAKALVRDDGGVGLLDPASGRIRHGRGVAVLDYATVVAEIEAARAGRQAR
ncbi:MAG: hypothetical protein AB1726_05625 [Planctomycetota bacterium]